MTSSSLGIQRERAVFPDGANHFGWPGWPRWIADRNAVLKVELDPSSGTSCCPGFDVRSGMRISFEATEVSTFIKLGLITAASDFVAGTQGSCVLVTEPDKITDVDFFQMVRVSAKLTTDPLSGGGAFTSWHLGLSDAIIYDFMSANPNLHKGQTVTFVGPLAPMLATKCWSNPTTIGFRFRTLSSPQGLGGHE